ncbi:SagB/ThcOx family dehydrogenase [Pseudomonas sp. BF-R-24]|uniref:SagB/ThcOx family dehydrogenase n=1 Tax=Pseudomonas sp. BF-R-24 TaxID=2832386 RepID=UPI001CBD2B2C|nr:SagB/ThcOx family dehydrogenase [Pseudomonas sp. BF-R-24]
MKNFKVNENLTITLNDGIFGLWNLQSGEQYEIFERRFFDRIFELNELIDLPYTPKEEDETLIEAGILLIGRQAEEYQEQKLLNGPWGWDLISKIFHFGSKHNFSEGPITSEKNEELGYVDFCRSIAKNIPNIDTERVGKEVHLPSYENSTIGSYSLTKALWERTTSRNFKKEPVSLEAVSNILFTTFGKIHGDSHKTNLAERGIFTVGYRRSSPSAGCLQATEAYLIALHITDLERGVYHYRSHQHKLTKLENEIKFDLTQTLCHQSFAIDAGFLIVLTSRFDKLWWKYPHSRAYRSALMDIGHLSQTFNLVATASGLNTWLTGYFIDDQLNSLIKVDGFKEHSLFVLAGGHGNSDPLSPGVAKLLKA